MTGIDPSQARNIGRRWHVATAGAALADDLRDHDAHTALARLVERIEAEPGAAEAQQANADTPPDLVLGTGEAGRCEYIAMAAAGVARAMGDHDAYAAAMRLRGSVTS